MADPVTPEERLAEVKKLSLTLDEKKIDLDRAGKLATPRNPDSIKTFNVLKEAQRELTKTFTTVLLDADGDRRVNTEDFKKMAGGKDELTREQLSAALTKGLVANSPAAKKAEETVSKIFVDRSKRNGPRTEYAPIKLTDEKDLAQLTKTLNDSYGIEFNGPVPKENAMPRKDPAPQPPVAMPPKDDAADKAAKLAEKNEATRALEMNTIAGHMDTYKDKPAVVAKLGGFMGGRALDKDNDGKVTAADFKLMDADKNGKLTTKELIAGMDSNKLNPKAKAIVEKATAGLKAKLGENGEVDLKNIDKLIQGLDKAGIEIDYRSEAIKLGESLKGAGKQPQGKNR